MSIIVALVIFGLLIFFHELGHFLLAKRGGIGVTAFSLGMGPAIFKKKVGETEYCLRIFPFGGSCAMIGEDEESDAENAFNKKRNCVILYYVYPALCLRRIFTPRSQRL